jgi:hypothetical protein
MFSLQDNEFAIVNRLMLCAAHCPACARQDRIPTWSLSYLFIGIIGIGFLFTFYDIFDITVSFIQTCTQIVPTCVPGGPPGSNLAAERCVHYSVR